VIDRDGLRTDWDQFRQLQRGSARRFLNTVMASPDADPVPFAIWTGALALAPPLMTAIRTSFRLAMARQAEPGVILSFVGTFRVFYVIYAMLVTFLLTAMIWEALLPDRDDQDVVGVLPVRPMVLAASRLAAGWQVIVAMALALAVPVALIFAAASATQPDVGSFPRVFAAHVLTIIAACCSVFFTLATIRAAAAIAGGERLANRIASLLQLVTILAMVEIFLFLPGILAEMIRTIQRSGPVPLYYAPPLWYGALYGWIAEGGPATRGAGMALLITIVPITLGIGLTLLPARHIARRVQESVAARRGSLMATVMRLVVTFSTRSTAVRGLSLFAVATLARNRRHLAIMASYAGFALAMAFVGLLTAGFRSRFNLDAPRQDNLAVPLVFLFFAVYGLRTALSRPADPGANWPFRISPPTVKESRRAARIVILTCGVGPVLLLTALAAFTLWPAGVAARVVLLDLAAGLILVEVAVSGWARLPCASLHAADTSTVRSKWPLQVLTLYLFAFRGADVEMLALSRWGGVSMTVAVLGGVIVALRIRARTRQERLLLDADTDGPQWLRLSEEVT
jgi:hypothetical protein